MKLFKWGVELFNGHPSYGHWQQVSKFLKLGKITIYLRVLSRYGTDCSYQDGQNYFLYIGRLVLQWAGPSYYSNEESYKLSFAPWTIQEVNYINSNIIPTESTISIRCTECGSKLVARQDGMYCQEGCEGSRETYIYDFMTDLRREKLFDPLGWNLSIAKDRSFFWILRSWKADLYMQVELFANEHFPELVHYMRLEYGRFVLNSHGYDPIGYSALLNSEHTYIFRSDGQAEEAFQELEDEKQLIIGYWYGIYEFEREVIEDYGEDPEDHIRWFYE